MRRYLFPILFVLVLVTPFALKQFLVGQQSTPAAAAAGRRIIIMTPHAEGIRREFQEGFSNWLASKGIADITVDYRNFGGGANDIVKYFDSSVDSLYRKTNTFNVDLVWGGGDYLFDVQLRKPKALTEGYLEPVKLKPELIAAAFPNKDIGGVKLYSTEGYWYGTALSSFGIVYNKDVLKYLKLPEPKTWADLADPRYRGWIVLADPTRSSSAKTAFMAIVEKAMSDAWEADAAARAKHDELKAAQKAAQAAGQKEKADEIGRDADKVYVAAMDPGWRKGMGLIRLIASNTRVFSNNSAAVPGIVGAGDAAAGMAIDFYGRTEVESAGDDRVGYVEPAGATIVNPDPIAVVRGAPNRELAMLFIEYVLSQPGQRLWNARVGAPGGPRNSSLRRLPIVPSIYQDQEYVSKHFTDQVNPFAVAGAFNTRTDRRGSFPILGELIQVSAIDTQPALEAARKRALAKGQGDTALGTFPFGQLDLTDKDGRKLKAGSLQRQSRYQNAKPVERLEMVRQWVKEFEEEYNASGK